jgi:ubiquinone/menaquinone biosynthesis C-methylase UbiE
MEECMNPWLLDYLCDPVLKTPLVLKNEVYDVHGRIQSGDLVNAKGQIYPIENGIPRFVERAVQSTVDGFGDQWNYFNYDDFYRQWLEQTVKNNFTGPEYFKDKIIVDAGAGHGMQARWMVEAEAKHVIALELSHSVDDVMARNLVGLHDKIDVIQCSIDCVPLRANSIPDLVLCHNVIQHTPDVAKTARALWEITAVGGEFMWNCYTRNDSTWLQRMRFRMYRTVRYVLQRSPFIVRLAYARIMSALRFVPGLGWLLEKSYLMLRGTVIPGPRYWQRAYRAGVVITYDGYGSHGYQHHLSFAEQKAIAKSLQPDEAQWRGQDRYFISPMPVSAALRHTKTIPS